MSFILTLHITGLCAVVPNRNEALVVLPNARDYDHDGSSLNKEDLTDQHIPMLCLPDDPSLTILTQRPEFPMPPGCGLAPIPLRAFPLDMEDLWVCPYDPVPVCLPTPTGDECPDPAHTPANHFGWICDMKEVGAARMDPQWKAPLPISDKVIARCHIGQGIWSTELLAASILDESCEDLYVVHWTYADMMGTAMNNSPYRAIADVVQVEIPIEDDDTVTFRSSTNGADLVVQGTGDDFDAFLVNVPLTTLFGIPAGVRGAEYHFAHFYHLALPPQLPVYVPTPDISDDNCGMLGSGTEVIPHCPPAMFED